MHMWLLETENWKCWILRPICCCCFFCFVCLFFIVMFSYLHLYIYLYIYIVFLSCPVLWMNELWLSEKFKVSMMMMIFKYVHVFWCTDFYLFSLCSLHAPIPSSLSDRRATAELRFLMEEINLWCKCWCFSPPRPLQSPTILKNYMFSKLLHKCSCS